MYANNLNPTSVVQLVRTSSIMRVVMSSSPDWSENFLIFHITYDPCLVIIEVWLSGSEPTRSSTLVQQWSVWKDPRSNFAAESKTKLLLYYKKYPPHWLSNQFQKSVFPKHCGRPNEELMAKELKVVHFPLCWAAPAIAMELGHRHATRPPYLWTSIRELQHRDP